MKELNRSGKMLRETFRPYVYVIMAVITAGAALLCISIGSVSIPAGEILAAVGNAVTGTASDSADYAIIISVRIPRVLCAALTGAALSVCGGAVQGLLRNPLADGSTLGVSSGASLGACIAIVLGITLGSVSLGGTTVFAILFAFGSLVFILFLADRLDHSMSTNTIILIGVVFSMFVSSAITLIISFYPEKVRDVMFWTMGSFSGSTYENVLLLLAALAVCGTVILRHSRELNAFAIGEVNAKNIGIDVRKVKIILLVAVSVLIGVCVSVGGTIAFVGLVTPHIIRMITGPNHRKLLPALLFGGAVFLMLCDLLARMLFNPKELNVGVITSFIGAVLFIVIFARMRRRG